METSAFDSPSAHACAQRTDNRHLDVLRWVGVGVADQRRSFRDLERSWAHRATRGRRVGARGIESAAPWKPALSIPRAPTRAPSARITATWMFCDGLVSASPIRDDPSETWNEAGRTARRAVD